MTPTVEYEIHLILPHPDLARPRVRLLREGAGWVLPHWQSSEPHFWQSTGYVNDGARAAFAAEATTLRCLSIAYDAASERVSRWYELENHGHSPARSPQNCPTPGEWLGPEALSEVADATQRAFLAGWFCEAADGVPPERRSWARPGWLAEAVAWIDERLHARGRRRMGPVEQVRTWERGCVLRVPTVDGDLYFKALPAMFAHEIPLIEALAAIDPGAVVTLLAVDRERHWMLMADMAGLPLDRVNELERWEEALRRFAGIQLATSANPDVFLALGCPDRRIETLAGRIDPFFDALSDYPGLSTQEIVRLRVLAPTLKERCAALAAFGIPAAVEHGDFWPGNVTFDDPVYIYFDWSDSTLSHPFFSLTSFLELDDIPHELPSGLDVTARLRDAYLTPWAERGDGESDDLLKAFELSRKLAPLHLALNYHERILPQMEARWEMENMVAFYLKMLLCQ